MDARPVTGDAMLSPPGLTRLSAVGLLRGRSTATPRPIGMEYVEAPVSVLEELSRLMTPARWPRWKDGVLFRRRRRLSRRLGGDVAAAGIEAGSSGDGAVGLGLLFVGLLFGLVVDVRNEKPSIGGVTSC